MASASACVGAASRAFPGVRTERPSRSTVNPSSAWLTSTVAQKRFAAQPVTPRLPGSQIFPCVFLERIGGHLGRVPVEHRPGPRHMFRQWCGHGYGFPRDGMQKADGAGVQVELAAHLATQLRAPSLTEVLLTRSAVLAVADDRV